LGYLKRKVGIAHIKTLGPAFRTAKSLLGRVAKAGDVHCQTDVTRYYIATTQQVSS
jgi:hypothetical protein